MNKPNSRKANPRRRRAPNQQATSYSKLLREKCKQAALTYKKLNFTIRQIADQINESFGPEGDDPQPRFKKISHHLVHTLIVEGIRESVDPLLKAEMRDLEIQQIDMLLSAAMGPAAAGSTVHMDMVLKLLARKAKLLGLYDEEDDSAGGGAGVTQIFFNGVMGRV